MAGSTGSRLTNNDNFWIMNENKCKTNDNNFGGVSVWCDSDNISNLIGKVRIGDKVELFSDNLPCVYWGIYLGGWEHARQCVVHFIPGSKEGRDYSALKNSLDINSLPASKDVLVVTPVCRFFRLRGGKARINNLKDEDWTPLGVGHIWQEVTNQLKKLHTESCIQQVYVFVSRISFKDSEDLVNYCRYDHWRINFGLVSEWCTSWQSLPRMRVGDRLEFYRSGRPYAHWGIYVGDWGSDCVQVVHFGPANGKGKIFSKRKSCGSQYSAKDQPVLRADYIEEVLENDKVRINNGRDETWLPLVRADIWDEINYHFKHDSDGHKQMYRLFSNNCEHFVNSCRYGQLHSDQIARFKFWMKKIFLPSK